MFKSIFSKLITIFISILLIGFSITGVMLYFFLDNFVTQDKANTLESSGKKVNELFEMYMDEHNFIENNYSNEDYKQYLRQQSQNRLNNSLQNYSESTKSRIWVVLEDGSVLLTEPALPVSVSAKLKGENGLLKLKDERQYSTIALGRVLVVTGDFFGFFKDPAFQNQGEGDSWLTVQVPFRYTIQVNDKAFKAAVFLHTPVPEVVKARTSVFNFFLWAVLVAIIISILLVYIFSLEITKPLKEINQAAKVISGGDFQKRLTIRSQDEIGELALSFNHMVTALQNLEDMRRGFIANVSHELRTPMTTIRGFIDGILDGTIPQERQSYYLTIVRDEISRLNRLVNDLLDLARMEAGELKLNVRTLDINELIRRCIIKLEGLIIGKSIHVEAIFEEETTLVSADADAIERVLYNLVHNAIKFTPEGGTIKIGTASQKEKVFVMVEDNGLGISSEEIDRIWERFYKSDKSRGKDKSGTGLGLAIVRNILHEHGENIQVESEIGKGTRFTFTLARP